MQSNGSVLSSITYLQVTRSPGWQQRQCTKVADKTILEREVAGEGTL